MEQRKRIAIMDWDDQFRIADRVVDVLASFGVKLDDYQIDVLVDEVMDVTDPFSVGVKEYYDEDDSDEPA